MSNRMRRLRAFCLVLGGVFACVSPGSHAAVLIVDDDGGTPYQTIQSAIDAAVPSVDTVLVRCGVYTENIVLRDLVDVSGESADCTIIDGGQNGTSVVTIVDIFTVTLQGFTIRNGSSSLGGGIYIEASSPTITRNIVADNSAVGVGIYNEGSGGGIHITTTFGRRAPTEPIVTGNIIRDNTADSYGGGIEVYSDSDPTISNNIIARNRAVLTGGGIDVFTANPTIFNNSILLNCLQGGPTACSGGGGGIALTDSAMDFSNNLVAWNEAVSGGGIDLAGSVASFASNNAFANVPSNYVGVVSDPTGSNGNISIDPLLTSQSVTWSGVLPRSDSPLVDTGTNLGLLVDVRGVPRPQDGDVDGVADVDIGARENEGVTRLIATAADTFSWDPSSDVTALFNLYRGDLAVFLSTGDYTQDPVGIPGARQWCGIGSPTQTDFDTPDPAQAFFYLATLDNLVEGTLGFTGAEIERPFTPPYQCP